MRRILLFLILLVPFTIHADAALEYLEKERKLFETIEKTKQNTEKHKTCLAQAIYFEASNYEMSQRAVGHVIINRTLSETYPDTICSVIHQRTTKAVTGKKVCQFSYLCEPKKRIVYSSSKWENSQRVAVEIIEAFLENGRNDPTNGATHFHDYRVHPTWAKSNSFMRTFKTSKLTFYKKK